MTFDEWWEQNGKQHSADACHMSEYHQASVVWAAAIASKGPARTTPWEGIGAILWMIQWAAGCVLAKGFWSTLAAVCTGGLWSLYLVVERLMLMAGVV